VHSVVAMAKHKRQGCNTNYSWQQSL